MNVLKNYLELTKPKVVLMMLITAIVGMLLASKTLPSIYLVIISMTGIGLCASSAATINQIIDRNIDANMARTSNRPLPQGEITTFNASLFAFAALLLVLIIFVWTPPHFWALAIYRKDDYARESIPMLPVTHGVRFTKLQIILYTVLLLLVSLLPFIVLMSGNIYLFSALGLGLFYLYSSIKMYLTDDDDYPMTSFKYSIYYIFLIFFALLVDHFI